MFTVVHVIVVVFLFWLFVGCSVFHLCFFCCVIVAFFLILFCIDVSLLLLVVIGVLSVVLCSLSSLALIMLTSDLLQTTNTKFVES